MNRIIKIYLFLFIAIIIAMIVSDTNKKEPIDWTSSFLSEHKKPFGTYVLYHELSTLFPNVNIQRQEISAYEYFERQDSIASYGIDEENEKDSLVAFNLKVGNYKNYLNPTNYIFINNSLNIDEFAIHRILKYVANGNIVFMATNHFPVSLKDTLGFETSYQFSIEPFVFLKMANKNISKNRFKYRKAVQNIFFNELDTLNTTILGYNKIKKENYHPNYIRIAYGDGFFLLNTQPYAFSNYHLLKSDHIKYVTACLSYLNNNSIFWDEKVKAQSEEIKTPLRFILSKPALKYAWFTAIFAIIIYMLFRAKRRQRIIPIIHKLPNTSIAFARTIGDLYYQEGEAKDIIHKKINYFLEYLRNRYLLETSNLNDEFIKKLHLKSGVSIKEINFLITFIVNISKRERLEENSLVKLNKLMDNFYQKRKQ